MMMMMSRFVERVLNSPRARCRSALAGGELRVLGGALTLFNVIITPEKNVFTARGAGAPTAPPGYAYAVEITRFPSPSLSDFKSLTFRMNVTVMRTW